jgi:hypothetical protein
MPRSKTLNEDYFNWLYSQIGKQSRTYFKLCHLLNTINYRWSIPNDDNRESDARRLRDIFAQETGLREDHIEVTYFIDKPVTVFEVLVALCGRIDEQLARPGDPDSRCAKWFLELLMNLHLAEYTDNFTPYERFPEMEEQRIYRTIEILLDRMYEFDGSGGLFPLKHKPRKDQRKVELWYQLQAYLAENYT